MSSYLEATQRRKDDDIAPFPNGFGQNADESADSAWRKLNVLSLGQIT